MAVPVIMPRQGQSVESCIISKWHKSKGDKVEKGELLFSYETDKASFDEEAKVSGTVLDIFFQEGDDVPVLNNVCVIGNEGENAADFGMPAVSGSPAESASIVVKGNAAADGQLPEKTVGTTAISAEGLDGRIKISPRARNLAEKSAIDFRFASPTGPGGRIIERDIINLRDTGPVVAAYTYDGAMASGITPADGSGIGGRITAGDVLNAVKSHEPVADRSMEAAAGKSPEEQSNTTYEEIKLSNIRKVIAKAMHNSMSTTAQLTLNTSFDASRILEFRKRLKENSELLKLKNITLNDIILYAVSRTILNHKSLNAHFLDDKMRVFNNVHLGIAVDTDRGLMVPTVFDADLKSLNEISAEVKGLAEQCQNGSIKPDFLKGASFTITNLGTLGIESFTPVLNPPQTGILGVCSIVQRVREHNGALSYYPSMGLSLTFDHRALDGAPAARFLKELVTVLENFDVFLAR